jgi:hypothetical protein
MNPQDTKQQQDKVGKELTWDFICEQLNKTRFTPNHKNHFGINLTENRYRRMKEDAKT